MKPKIRQFTPLIAFLLSACSAPAGSQEQDIHDRMMHSRAVDAVVWAMPLLNFKGFRDGHAAAGVGPNDVAYFSQIQNWKFQTATPNNTTPYVNFYWNIADGPVVVEILDVKGQRVRKLVDETQGPGPQTATWDGTDQAGQRVSSGVYFALVAAQNEYRVVKLALLK